LDVGRITSGKLQLRMQRVRVADVLETAVESTRSFIESRAHELSLDIREQNLTVEADPDRLVQVFSNLLINSAKYTERGGNIRVSLESEADEAIIAVADNGIGIPPQSIPNVFEMFSQLGTHPSRAEGGLGIGLALVYRLVQMHSGTVSAASQGPGMGSTFTVRLPFAPAADAIRPVSTDSAALPAASQVS
jgi:signal transduction histidine kinase